MTDLALIVDADALEDTPHAYHLRATDQEREEVAQRLGLLSLESMEAEVTVEKRGLVYLKGFLTADVVQECVRTFKPVKNHLEIEVNEIFTLKPLPPEVEEDEEAPAIEYLEDAELDVGEVIVQLLSLNLDPFPVAPDSKPVEYREGETPDSPFSVLKKKE